jgi:hypothetical protein
MGRARAWAITDHMVAQRPIVEAAGKYSAAKRDPA